MQFVRLPPPRFLLSTSPWREEEKKVLRSCHKKETPLLCHNKCHFNSARTSDAYKGNGPGRGPPSQPARRSTTGNNNPQTCYLTLNEIFCTQHPPTPGGWAIIAERVCPHPHAHPPPQSRIPSRLSLSPTCCCCRRSFALSLFNHPPRLQSVVCPCTPLLLLPSSL